MKKEIPEYNNIYFADIYGNIYRQNKLLKPVNNGNGYFQIKLRKNHKRKAYYVHRIVWETFKGKIPNGYEINHIDQDKSNNCLSNLELVSHSENMHKSFLKYGYYGSMRKPKTLTLSQAKSTLFEGAETTGDV